MKCRAHRIAAGPDGRCVVCRRDERERAGRRLGWVAVLGLAVVAGALLLLRPLRGVVLSTSASRPAAVTAEVVAAPTAEPTARDVSELEAAPPPAPRAAPAVDGALAVGSGVAAPAASASIAVPAPELGDAAAPPSQAAIDAALRSTRIEMFATAWCGVCRRARAFLAANGLSYRERDIDRDPAALEELRRRSGGTAVPTFAVEGQMQSPGFSEATLTRAMVASVERRLGVSGIQIVNRSAPP